MRFMFPILFVSAILLIPQISGAQSPSFLYQWGSAGTAPGQFQLAHGIAVGQDGEVYVADTANNRIQKFHADGSFVTQWTVSFPSGVDVDPSGNVVVSTGDFIRVFTPGGLLLRFWGGTGSTAGKFRFPLDVATDALGNVFVADWLNHRVQQFSDLGIFVREWGTQGSGEGQFEEPSGLVVDADNFVYVVDMDLQRVQKFTSAGVFVNSWGGAGSGDGQFSYPNSITIDPMNLVLVSDSDNHRIQAFRQDGTFVLAFGSQGSGPGQFAASVAIDVDAIGRIFVMDKDNARVQVFGEIAIPVRRVTWGGLKATLDR